MLPPHDGTQARSDSRETIAHGSVGDAELVGRRLVGVPLGDAELEDAPVGGRHVGHFIGDARREIAVDHLLRDVDRVGVALVDGSCDVLALAATRADPVRRHEAADRREPRQRGVARELKPAHLLPRRRERLLRRIFGVAPVSEEPVRDPEHRAHIGPKQLAERQRVALAEAATSSASLLPCACIDPSTPLGYRLSPCTVSGSLGSSQNSRKRPATLRGRRGVLR